MISRLRISLVLALAIGFAASQACANGSPPPTPTPSPPVSATAGSDASARQGQQQGQQQGQAQQANSGASISQGSDSFRSSLWVLPAPVFTPPMAAIDCPAGVKITNEAAAIGWNFASVARGSTDNSDCVLIAVRNAYVEQCQYGSAKQVQDGIASKHLAGFERSKTVYLDLTHKECSDLRAPPVTVRTEYVYLPSPVVELPKVKPAPKPVKRHKAVFVPKCAPVASAPACKP